MFNGKSKTEFANETGGNSTSLIGNGTTLKGDINSNGDLRIDGHLIGNINTTAKVVIGANGIVEGDIIGTQADIMGKVTGTIKVKELLQLKASAVVNGNIHAGKLQVEPAATFNGGCHMGNAGEKSTAMNEKQKASNAA
ncbi:polymer-forming cytoskeletal protein [Flavihumibacter rivuli]|uniref:bactofilin family protein n=1 Tax=Flavihumibacter rivuli TaxID=2838156 RepID=UPI001BDE9FB8|nr:polymer-forming cytoskeletal protein [Flavihumibacter rivuli]ULQ57044.1 polymer-forming cytoskeletal protein [Flavihumibacter rivuli]